MQVSRRAVLTASLASVGAALTGCGASPAGPAASSPGAAAADRPLVLGVPAPPRSRDPLTAWDVESQRILRQVLEPLLGVDPDTGAPVPLVARSHEVSADGRVHTFRLVEGLTFSDGSPCDASAVVANVRRWAAPPATADGTVPAPSPFTAAFGGHEGEEGTAFAGVEAPDAHTVVLRLHRRLRHLAAALSSPQFALCAPGSWDRTVEVDGARRSTPLGTGPYRWAEQAEHDAVAAELTGPGTTTVLVPNGRRGEADTRPESPDAPDRPVAVRAWGRAETRLRELRRGTADVIDVVAPGQLRPLVEAGTQVLPRDPFAVLSLGMNMAHPQMRSQHLREAVAYAVDRPAIASSDVFLQGTTLAHDLVPPALGVADEEARRYDVNPARAERLLALAGYDGEPLEFLYPAGSASPALPEPERIAAMVAGDLGAVGIRVEPVPVPPEEDYLRAVLSRPLRALHLSGRQGHYRDPHAFLEPVARSGRAETNYENPRVLRLLDEAAAEDDDERRRELFRQIVRSMALDLPALPLVYPISSLAIGHRVGAYPTSPQLDEPFARIQVTDP